MKLYTEEQVKIAMRLSNQLTHEKYYLNADQVIQQLKPIELPSDEEIRKWAEKQSEMEPTGEEEFGRVCGAKWMRDKIQGGNK